MSKEDVFDFEDRDFEISDFVLFINKVIQFKDILAHTKIEIAYNNCLMKFLSFSSSKFHLEPEQLEIINRIMEENKEMNHDTLLKRNFDDFAYSVTDQLKKQPNIYEQYKLIIQNKKYIISMLKASDINDKDLHERYLELGKSLLYIYYNKSFRFYLSNKNIEKNNDDDEGGLDEEENEKNDFIDDDDLYGMTYMFYDGYENKGEINAINTENFYVYSDDKIEELRQKICDVIIVYCEQYIDIVEEFAIQYVIYVLMKRMYFYNYQKNEKKINFILPEVLVNLCFFEDSILNTVSYFINRILKSERNEDQTFKNNLIEKINESIGEEDFLYKYPKSLKHLEKKSNKINKRKFNKKNKNKNDRKVKIITIKKNKKDDEEEEDEDDDDEEKEEEDENINKRKNKKGKNKNKINKKKKEEKEEKEKEEEEEKEEEKKDEEKKEKEEEKREEDEEDFDLDENDDEDGQLLSKIDNEGLIITEKDLRVGFFNSQNVKAGTKFIFYEEINNSYGILDFCMNLDQLDINLSITDITEGRIIYSKKGLDQLIDCPVKILMFFSNPHILKFEFDNSYSWITSKTVRYKTNVFYPKNPYIIGHQILISKYQNTIIKGKKLRKEKEKKKK